SHCRLSAELLFFFSSRRRHTRSDRDWSSDVCSSDLSSTNSTSSSPPTTACSTRSGVAETRAGDPHSRRPYARSGGSQQSGQNRQIGRASCRERVQILGGAVAVKRKK